MKTKISKSSSVGILLLPSAKETNLSTMGLAGKKVPLFELPSTHIEFSNYNATIPTYIQDIPNTKCPHDGLLGMDILKSCTILMSKDKIATSCQN